jgi:serine/threonine-protein kinase RsbW
MRSSTPAGRSGSHDISVQMPSELDAVQETIELITSHCLAWGLPARTANFRVRVALAEALANAVRYGNGMNPSKTVDVLVRALDESVEIHVQDQGPGFDPDAVPDPTTPDRLEQEDGRGLFLISRLADDLSFNERGNAICMVWRRA